MAENFEYPPEGLKTCPFCGCDCAGIYKEDDGSFSFPTCTSPCCMDVRFPTAEMAIKAWNNRA